MSFFDSEVVQAEMQEISQLQEEVYESIFQFPSMSRDDKISHVEMLERLLDKQKILYTRLSLSSDIEAKRMKEKIVESATMMGMPTNMDMNVVFTNMTNMLQKMKDKIDDTGSNL
tara:strand:+ start:943 stop:1287 length:345 start_codon:yes stop_codon:yes gene_type:complete